MKQQIPEINKHHYSHLALPIFSEIYPPATLPIAPIAIAMKLRREY
jgi:hypothetical protein